MDVRRTTPPGLYYVPEGIAQEVRPAAQQGGWSPASRASLDPGPLAPTNYLFRAAESLAACELRSWRAPVSALAISPAEIPESRASSWRPKPFLNLRLRSCFPFIFSPFSKGQSPAPLGSYTPDPLKSSPGRKCSFSPAHIDHCNRPASSALDTPLDTALYEQSGRVCNRSPQGPAKEGNRVAESDDSRKLRVAPVLQGDKTGAEGYLPGITRNTCCGLQAVASRVLVSTVAWRQRLCLT